MKRLAAKRRRALRNLVCGLILAPTVTQGTTASAQITGGQITGGTVVAGQASISHDATTTNINTLSDRTIINWQGFSLDAGQTANFLQPGASSAVLNRVTTPNNPSAIYGAINSNGNVILVNPSGIVVGPSGVINTNGFTASVLDIPDNEFLKGGALNFRGDSTASVINRGTITTGDGGAALIGGDVVNEGTITSDGGSISLATGGSVTLADGSRFTHADLATIESGISPYAGVIQNSGTIRATGAVESGGEVYLVNPGGKIMHDGTITANRSTATGQSGGIVSVDAATTATVRGAITADATGTGDGGNVRVWADEATEFTGSISARGGSGAGDGGEVEVSGAKLTLGGTIDVAATTGNAGTVTLDPAILDIDAAAAGTIVSSLAGGGTVNVEADEQINVNAAIDSSSQANAATLNFRDESGSDVVITLNADITLGALQDLIFDGVVSLGSDTSLSANDVTFNSTIDGEQALVINADGVTRFNGAVGRFIPLATLQTDAAGTSELDTGGTATDASLRTTGGATFGDPTTLLSNFTAVGPSGSTVDTGGVTFDNTLDGARQMIISVRGPVVFNGAVGSNVPLSSLQVRGIIASNSGVFLNGGPITTTGIQRYLGNVVLGADTTLTSTNNSVISFNGINPGISAGGSLNGPFALTINTGGATTFFTDVGSFSALASLTTDAGGTTSIQDGVVTTTGNQTYNDDVTTVGQTTLSATGLDSTIAIEQGVFTDNENLTISADDIAINASIDAGTGIVTLAPSTSGRGIDLGTETAGSLGLTDAEVDLVTAGILRIGTSASGDITFSDTISPANTDTLSLTTGGKIIDSNSTATDVRVANLALRTANGVADTGGTIILDTEVETLAALNSTGGGISIVEHHDGGDLTVGTVDGIVGITNNATSGPLLGVQLETNNGNLVIDQSISSTRGNLFLVAQSAGSGDKLFDNNASISAANGNIQIVANNMALEGGAINAGSGRVVLQNDLSGVAIDLGGADASGVLGLTDAEIDTVSTSGVLQIGHLTRSGDITITEEISPANASTLDLETAGAVLDGHTGTDITVQNLAIRTGGGIGTSGNAVGINVDNLAFANTGGVVNLSNPKSLSIDQVDGLGSSSNTGTTTNIELLGTNDLLTIGVDASSNGNATLTAGSIDVGNGVIVDSNAALAFNANTVNLDGDLNATGGITGTATTVNVLGDSGGAEIQDAVDVATDAATVNVGAGSFDGGIIIDKALTLLGNGISGNTTTVNVSDSTTGMTIASSNVVVDGVVFSGDGSPNAATGILVDGSTGSVSGIVVGDSAADADVQGNRFEGLTTGLVADSGGGLNSVSLTIGDGNVFTGNTDGIVLDGLLVDLVGDTLANTVFGTHSGNYVELAGGAEYFPGFPTVIDATGVTFEGLDLSEVGDTIAVQDKLVHYLDIPTLGLINVGTLGVAEGESIQLAVNAAGLIPGMQTVHVDNGTFGGSVEVWVDGLSIVGQGDTTVIDTDSVDAFANNGDRNNGFEVVARSSTAGFFGAVTDVTIEGFNFETLSSSGNNTGIVLGQNTLRSAVGTTIQNNRFNDLQDGVVANAISGTTTLADNTMTAINQQGIDIRPVLALDDTIIVTGNDIQSRRESLRFNQAIVGSDVQIAGNALTSSTRDAIQFRQAIAGANIMIGGPSSADSNRLQGDDEAIHVDSSLTLSQFTVTGNELIDGQDAGIRFDNAVTLSDVAILENGQISGGDNAILFRDDVSVSRIDVAGNKSIVGQFDDAIRFDRPIENSIVNIGATAIDQGNGLEIIGGNGEIVGGDDGINIDEIEGSLFTVTDNGRVEGFEGSGIEFDDTVDDSLVVVAANGTIIGGEEGIEFDTNIADSAVVISANDAIVGRTNIGIQFKETIEGSLVNIGGLLPGLGNGEISGTSAGVEFDGGIGQSIVRIVGNTLVQGTHDSGDGIRFDAPIEGVDTVVSIAGNGAVIGGNRGLEFNDAIQDASVAIRSNRIVGQGSDAVLLNGMMTDAQIVIGGPSSTDGNELIAAEDGIDADAIRNGRFVVANNAITADSDGVQFDGTINGDAQVVVTSNQITGRTGVNQDSSIRNDAVFAVVDNLIELSPMGSFGIAIRNLDSSQPAVIRENTVVGGESGGVGIMVIQTAGDPAGHVVIDGGQVTVTNGIGAHFSNTTQEGSLQVTLQNGVTIIDSPNSSGGTGILFSGPGLRLTGDTLADTKFIGTTGNFVVLRDGALFEPGQPTLIDGTEVDWNGLDPAITAQRELIVAKIIDYLDNPTLGLIFPGAGLGDEQTYDRFTRYQDWFRTVASLLGPNRGTIKYPAPTITNELDDEN